MGVYNKSLYILYINILSLKINSTSLSYSILSVSSNRKSIQSEENNNVIANKYFTVVISSSNNSEIITPTIIHVPEDTKYFCEINYAAFSANNLSKVCEDITLIQFPPPFIEDSSVNYTTNEVFLFLNQLTEDVSTFTQFNFAVSDDIYKENIMVQCFGVFDDVSGKLAQNVVISLIEEKSIQTYVGKSI